METVEYLFKTCSVVWNHPTDVSSQYYFTQEMDRFVERYDYEFIAAKFIRLINIYGDND